MFATSLVMLPAAALGLRLFAFGRVHRFFAGDAAALRIDGDDTARALETAHMVAAAGHYAVFKATCLPQSLVLQWHLRRQGIRSDLRFGVREEGPGIDAHAWVEHRGVPLIDSPAVRERFAELRGAR